MRNLIKILVVVSVWIFGSSTNAQTYKDSKALENIQAKTSLFSVVNAQNNNALGVSKSTHVQQVGNYNAASAITRSSYSDIRLTQVGNKNDIGLLVSANKISEDIFQLGNNHSFTDFTKSRSNLHDVNVLQYGSNQNLILLGGQNSLSDKMKVTMQGRNQTVIVRSLNK